MAFFFSCFLIWSQKEYKGRLLDIQTNLPIPYVNIGIVDKGIGTVSDEDGLFHFDLSSVKISETDEILFSAMGYESLHIPVKNVRLVYNDYIDVFLKPRTFELKEVVVSNKGGRFIRDNIGYRNFEEENYGYWKDNIALGGELATRIIAKSGIRKLNRFEFDVWHNPSDSLLLRVNIYEDDGKMGRPGTSLNTSGKNILCTVKSDDKIVQVDLNPYDIYVKDDFMVSLELLKVYGDKELGLILSAAFNTYGSYRKYASQAKWERLSDLNMAYYIESELMVSEKEALRYERKIEKKKKKQRTLSGFVIMRGKMVPGVKVFNKRTKESVLSDAKGRYTIPAKKDDILIFSKKGLQEFGFKVTDRVTQNAVMKSD